MVHKVESSRLVLLLNNNGCQTLVNIMADELVGWLLLVCHASTCKSVSCSWGVAYHKERCTKIIPLHQNNFTVKGTMQALA